MSIDEPLTETQVLAYLKGLSAAGHRIYLMTFEPKRPSRGERAAKKDTLAKQGIRWTALRYHKRPSLPATLLDTLMGAFVGTVIAWRHRIDVVHARIHVPGAMALAIRRLSRAKMIFDVRGLMAEEYVDAGRWKPNGIPFRTVKWVERRCLARAAGVVVLTKRARALLQADHSIDTRAPRWEVIPSCADVAGIAAASNRRTTVRSQLGWESQRIMVYTGKFSGWYMATEMADFFAMARTLDPSLRFLILTQSGSHLIEAELDRARVPSELYSVGSVTPSGVGAYLAAADFGISFINPSPSKVASSPTKVGEYLAAGLPIVSTTGIGDVDEILARRCGVLVAQHSPRAHLDAYENLLRLLEDPQTKDRCRVAAQEEFSLKEVGIPRYLALYRSIEVTRPTTA